MIPWEHDCKTCLYNTEPKAGACEECKLEKDYVALKQLAKAKAVIKKDCLYYEEAKDMGATVHWCKSYREIIATCSWCDEYVHKDLVPVVRCKDCKFGENNEPGLVWCPRVIGPWMNENGYCSRGERREDD